MITKYQAQLEAIANSPHLKEVEDLVKQAAQEGKGYVKVCLNDINLSHEEAGLIVNAFRRQGFDANKDMQFTSEYLVIDWSK